MNKFTSKSIFKGKAVGMEGWIVDLSPDGWVNPDFWWGFHTKREAQEFLRMVNAGKDPYTVRLYLYEKRRRNENR